MSVFSIFKSLFSVKVFAFAVLLVSIIIQFFVFWKSFFLHESFNGDESEYYYAVESLVGYFDSFYTGSIPFILPSYLFDLIFDVQYPTRYVSLLFGVLLLYYIYIRFKSIFQGFKLLYYTAVCIFALISFRQIFIGTSDFMASSLCMIGFVELGRYYVDLKKSLISYKRLIAIGAIFGLAVMARPTSILTILVFILIVFLMFRNKEVFSVVALITLTMFSVILCISIPNLIQYNVVKLDVKIIPEEDGTSWYEMNYLMAKHWDDGTLPRGKWYSSAEVHEFKKNNPEFNIPRNHFQILIENPGLYIRTLSRETARGLYSLFLNSLGLLLFSLILIYHRFKNRIYDFYDKEILYILIYVFILMLAFAFISVKLFEFRWVHSACLLFIFKSIVFCDKYYKNSSLTYCFISLHCLLFSCYTLVRLLYE